MTFDDFARFEPTAFEQARAQDFSRMIANQIEGACRAWRVLITCLPDGATPTASFEWIRKIRIGPDDTRQRAQRGQIGLLP
ncbi:MAG: hypothetical protein EPN36_06590 [Rhodanobacteraceae bacterium]|nr:MAG: hypothetical protein EPN36_06590 [Rhodanobacteraceae bacterium]